MENEVRMRSEFNSRLHCIYCLFYIILGKDSDSSFIIHNFIVSL